MKKYIFILAALFAVTTIVNAQISIEKTFTNQEVYPATVLNGGEFRDLPCPFYCTTSLVQEASAGEYWNNEWAIHFLNATDFSEYKTLKLKENEL